MSKRAAFAVTISLAAIVSCLADAQVQFTYRERTGASDVFIAIREEIVPTGSIVHSSMSDGDIHRVELDASAATITYHVESPARKTSYTAYREGNVIRVEGTLAGRPLSRRLSIDGRPWYESMERSLRDYAISGSSAPVLFWVVNPWNAWAYLLQAMGEKSEKIVVNDRTLTALRVKVSAAGILALFWSTRYWFRPSDGMCVRSEGARGFPGTPMTIVEMINGD